MEIVCRIERKRVARRRETRRRFPPTFCIPPFTVWCVYTKLIPGGLFAPAIRISRGLERTVKWKGERQEEGRRLEDQAAAHISFQLRQKCVTQNRATPDPLRSTKMPVVKVTGRKGEHRHKQSGVRKQIMRRDLCIHRIYRCCWSYESCDSLCGDTAKGNNGATHFRKFSLEEQFVESRKEDQEGREEKEKA